MIDKLEKDISTSLEVFENMPKTTAKNKAKFDKDISVEIEKYEKMNKEVYLEIKERNKPYDNIVFNDYNDLLKGMDKFSKALLYTTDLNTPYEKLRLDKIIYDLSFQENMEDSLNFINKKILTAFYIFETAGINLCATDFKYTNYVYEYMNVFFKYKDNLAAKELKDTFDSVYWKCPKLLLQIELNIRYLYLKNEKVFKKYIKVFNDKLLSNFKDGDASLSADYTYIRSKYDECIICDKSNLLYKFYHDEYNDSDYAGDKIDSIKSSLFSSFDSSSAFKLLNSLYEYREYSDFLPLVNKIRELYKEEIPKDFLMKNLKAISKLENKLFALNKKSSGRSSVTMVDKYDPAIFSLIDEIKKLYDEIDSNIMKVKIKKHLQDNSTIFKALLLVCYNYSLLANCFKELDDSLSYEEIDKKILKLHSFVLNPNNTVITNLTILDESVVSSIIASNYRLSSVNISVEMLENDLDSLISDLEKIKISLLLSSYDISISNISFIKQGKLIVEKYENS